MCEINCPVSDSRSLNQHQQLSCAELYFLLALHGWWYPVRTLKACQYRHLNTNRWNTLLDTLLAVLFAETPHRNHNSCLVMKTH